MSLTRQKIVPIPRSRNDTRDVHGMNLIADILELLSREKSLVGSNIPLCLVVAVCTDKTVAGCRFWVEVWSCLTTSSAHVHFSLVAVN